MGDEDSSVEHHLLNNERDHVVSIAGSGGRIIPLLAKFPKRITCIDILNEQLYITELRLKLVEQLECQQYKSFLGYPPYSMSPSERENCFKKLNLSVNAKNYLFDLFSKNGWKEIIYLGKFESTLITLFGVNHLLTGKAGQKIFECRNIDEQVDFFHRKFPKFRWNMVVFLLGNSTILNTLLYKGDFPKKNIPGSYYSLFKKIFVNLFTKISARKSFFLQLIFFGRLITEEANPIEASEAVFYKAKKALSDCIIDFHNGDIITFLQNAEKHSVDFVSLSDVPSFLDDRKAGDYLKLIKQAVKPGGRVVVRSNLRVARPQYTGEYIKISPAPDDERVIENEATQLWKVDIYEVI